MSLVAKTANIKPRMASERLRQIARAAGTFITIRSRSIAYRCGEFIIPFPVRETRRLSTRFVIRNNHVCLVPITEGGALAGASSSTLSAHLLPSRVHFKCSINNPLEVSVVLSKSSSCGTTLEVRRCPGLSCTQKETITLTFSYNATGSSSRRVNSTSVTSFKRCQGVNELRESCVRVSSGGRGKCRT